MNATRAHRAATQGQRTDASQPRKNNIRYSAADQAKALGSGNGTGTGAENDTASGLADTDEERAKRRMRSDYHDLSGYMRAAAAEMDSDRMKWSGGGGGSGRCGR